MGAEGLLLSSRVQTNDGTLQGRNTTTKKVLATSSLVPSRNLCQPGAVRWTLTGRTLSWIDGAPRSHRKLVTACRQVPKPKSMYSSVHDMAVMMSTSAEAQPFCRSRREVRSDLGLVWLRVPARDQARVRNSLARVQCDWQEVRSVLAPSRAVAGVYIKCDMGAEWQPRRR